MRHFVPSVILTDNTNTDTIHTCYRLIETADIFAGDDVYSLFLTTQTETDTEEEFLYDIARDRNTAEDFFHKICENGVTACTLFDVAEDFLGVL